MLYQRVPFHIPKISDTTQSVIRSLKKSKDFQGGVKADKKRYARKSAIKGMGSTEYQAEVDNEARDKKAKRHKAEGDGVGTNDGSHSIDPGTGAKLQGDTGHRISGRLCPRHLFQP